jgi:2,4-diketo-3-deoxy-L-fuconate hydrolase
MRIAVFNNQDSWCFAAKYSDGLHVLEGVRSFRDLVRARLDGFPLPNATAVEIPDSLLAPPIGSPSRNVFCVGWNYLPHFEEGKSRRGPTEAQVIPSVPTFFSKATTAVIGPYASVSAHADITSLLDWEVELAVVIGRAGTGISEASALDYVFGYCVANDISARDLQKTHGGQWFKGKSLDRSCPLGPYLVSADEVPDPQQLELLCRVNGQLKQRSNTRHMVFPVRRIIEELSRGLTLLPGDVILTGTPEGIGAARNPPERLRPGDVLESEIVGLGVLRNTVVSESHAQPF